MTHEEYVNLETAKLLKKAGFDWECPTFYTETFDYRNQDGTGKFEFRRNDNLRYQNPNDDLNSFVNHKGTLLEYKFEMYSAPTQAVAQRWLREVKNREVVVDVDMRTAHLYIPLVGTVKPYVEDNMPVVAWKRSDHKFPSYEAALESGLQHCLKILTYKNA